MTVACPSTDCWPTTDLQPVAWQKSGYLQALARGSLQNTACRADVPCYRMDYRDFLPYNFSPTRVRAPDLVNVPTLPVVPYDRATGHLIPAPQQPALPTPVHAYYT